MSALRIWMRLRSPGWIASCLPTGRMPIRSTLHWRCRCRAFEAAVVAVLDDPNVMGGGELYAANEHRADPTAEAIAALRSKSTKPLLPVWMGRQGFCGTQGVPAGKMAHYRTPEHAVEVFYAISSTFTTSNCCFAGASPQGAYRRAKVESARMMIEHVLGQGRTVLTESEAKSVLAEFGIPVNLTRLARSEDEAVVLAGEMGYPVALKIESHDILHKTDGGRRAIWIPKPLCSRPMPTSAAGCVSSARTSGFPVLLFNP